MGFMLIQHDLAQKRFFPMSGWVRLNGVEDFSRLKDWFKPVNFLQSDLSEYLLARSNSAQNNCLPGQILLVKYEFWEFSQNCQKSIY